MSINLRVQIRLVGKDYLRIEDILLSYWNELKEKEGAVPHEDRINYKLIADVWDDCFLALITPDRGYRYEYLGKHLIDAYGEDMTELGVERIISPNAHETVRKFDDVMNRKEPIRDEGEFTNNSHFLIRYRQILLPFVNSDDAIVYILGGMRWKLYQLCVLTMVEVFMIAVGKVF